MYSKPKDVPLAASTIFLLMAAHLAILAMAIWLISGWASEQFKIPAMPFQVTFAVAYIISSLVPSKGT